MENVQNKQNSGVGRGAGRGAGFHGFVPKSSNCGAQRGARRGAGFHGFVQIRCTGTAYCDIRTKSAAQVPNLLTFASM